MEDLETLKITFEIGGEKIMVETDSTKIDSSLDKAKLIARLLTEGQAESASKRGRKPGPKPKAEAATVTTTEEAPKQRKKPGPKPGTIKRKPGLTLSGRPRKKPGPKPKAKKTEAEPSGTVAEATA